MLKFEPAMFSDDDLPPDDEQMSPGKRYLLRNIATAQPFLRDHLIRTTRAYWRTRGMVAEIARRLSRIRWNTSEFFRTRAERTSLVLGVTSKFVLAPLLYSFFLVAFLLFADHGLEGIFPGHLPTVARDAFFQLGITLAGIGGAFIGLYFTAISVVASTSYRDVPDDVRIAALDDQLGNFYLAIVVTLASASVLMCCIVAIGLDPGRLNFVFLTLVGMSGILSFVPLGRRAMAFLDPARLGNALGQRLLQQAAHAGADGRRATQEWFQARYHHDAENALSTLENVVQVSLRGGQSNSISLRRLAKHILDILVAYTITKPRIPRDSRWFPRQARFRSWITSSTAYVHTAQRTKTQIQPEEAANYLWIEQRLVVALGDTVASLLSQSDHYVAHEVLSPTLDAIEALTYHHRFSEARLLSRMLAGLSVPANDSQLARRALARRASFDMTRRGPTAQIVGFVRSLGKDCGASIRSWAQSGPSFPHPPDTICEAKDYFRRSEALEQFAEGADVTPDWFNHHVIGSVFLAYHLDCIERLTLDMRADYDAGAALANKTDALHVVQLGLEACEKALYAIRATEVLSQQLQPFNRPIGEHQWPKFTASALTPPIDALAEQLVDTLAILGPIVPKPFNADEGPDDFGFAYVTLAEEVLNRLLKNKTIDLVFPAYFTSALVAYNRLHQELASVSDETRVAFKSDIIADLCDLSGYALLLKDFGLSEPWQTVETTWSAYLSETPDAPKLIATSLSFLDQLLSIPPRAIVRTEWRTRFVSHLVERGLATRPDYPPLEIETHTGGAIAGAFLMHSMGERAHDAFLAAYLSNHPNFSGVVLPSPARRLAQTIARLSSEPRDPEVDE